MEMGNLAPQAKCYFTGADPRNPEPQETATSRCPCHGLPLGDEGTNPNEDVFLSLLLPP